MSINASILRKLATLQLNSDQVSGVLDIIASMSEEEEARKAAQRERTNRRRLLIDVSAREWELLRGVVFERDGFVCAYCGTMSGPFEIDHVIPVARGGTSVLSNLKVACSPCNASKRDHLLEEWVAR